MDKVDCFFQMDSPDWAAVYEAVKEEPTPFYLFQANKAADNIRTLRQFLDGVGIAYAMKANPWVAPAAAREASYIEVCSAGELEFCRAHGIAGRQITLDGVRRSDTFLQKSLEYGVTRFGVDSPQQMEHLLGCSFQRPITVLLRATSGNQFGMGEDALQACVRLCRGRKEIQSIGLQYYPGTQRADIRRVRRELEQLRKWIAFCETIPDFRPTELEFGAGLGVPYFEDEPIYDYKVLLDTLSSFTGDLTAEGYHVTYEAGRLIAAACGIYVTEIFSEKRQGRKRLLFCQGGTNHLCYHGGLLGVRTPKMKGLCARPSGFCEESTVCGPLCSEADVLARNCRTLDSSLTVGDRIVFLGAGAYAATEAMFLFLGLEMPRILLHHENNLSQEVCCVREALPTYPLIDNEVWRQ